MVHCPCRRSHLLSKAHDNLSKKQPGFFWFHPGGATYLAAVQADKLTNLGATTFSSPCVISDKVPLQEQHHQQEVTASLQVGTNACLAEVGAERCPIRQDLTVLYVPSTSPHCYRTWKKAPLSVYSPRNHETSTLQRRAARAVAALQHFSTEVGRSITLTLGAPHPHPKKALSMSQMAAGCPWMPQTFRDTKSA